MARDDPDFVAEFEQFESGPARFGRFRFTVTVSGPLVGVTSLIVGLIWMSPVTGLVGFTLVVVVLARLLDGLRIGRLPSLGYVRRDAQDSP